MAIFSYKNDFIFFHIPKCGGTSLSYILKDVTNKEKYIKHTHYTYVQAKTLFDQHKKEYWFENTKKIAIVRDPMQRLISMYAYIKSHNNHYLHKRAALWNFKQFNIYVKSILEITKTQDKILTCFDYVKNDLDEVQNDIHLFKLENLHKKEELEKLSDLTKCKIKKLPNLNCTFHPEENFEDSLELVKEIFKIDYEKFLY